MSNNIALLPVAMDVEHHRQDSQQPEEATRNAADGLSSQIRGRWVQVAGTAAGVWLAAAAVLYFLPERYTATASVFIEPDARPAIAAGHSSHVDASRIESDLAIIASRPLAERVIAHLELYRDPDINPAARPAGPAWLPAWASGVFSDSGPENTPDVHRLERIRARMMDRFLSRLRATRSGGSRVIEIAFTSATAEAAAAVANALAETYVIDKAERTFAQSKRASEWMDERLSELRRKAEESEDAVDALRRKASLLDEAASRRTREIAELKNTIDDITAQRARAKETLEKAESQLGAGQIDTAIGTLGSEQLRRLHAYVTGLQREFVALSDRLDAADPRLVNLRDEILAAKEQFKSTTNRILQKLRIDIDAALARENSIRFRLSQLERVAPAEIPTAGPKLVSLQYEAKSNRELYERFLSQAKMTTAFYGAIAPPARVVSRADIPLSPSFPSMPEYLAIAFAAAVLAGFFVAFIAARRDGGFRSLEQIERDSGLPALGLIPSVRRFWWWGMNPEDYMLEKPVSAYSEAVRSLHMGLLLSNVDAPPRLVMVTSAAPNEGKTSLALSFARMVGRIGQKRVVLVDCDLRHPQVDHKLGLLRAPGLVEYLMEEATLEEILQVDEKSNALVIAAGRMPTNSVELLTSDRFADLLAKLSEACDLVILDSSPVLAVCDSRILARLVDRTVFAARWAKTRRAVVKRAVREIRAAGGDIAGVVLTRVNVRRHARFGYGDSGVYRGTYLKYYSG